MGDTGSMALGGAIAGIAILTETEVLLVFIGGIYRDRGAVGDRSRWRASSAPGSASS